MIFGRRRRARDHATVCALVLSLLGYAPPAWAEEPTAAEKETARSLMWSGDQALERGDTAGALRDYLAADAIMGVPTTGLAVAKAQLALGQLVEARDSALVVSRSQPQPGESPLFAAAREEAATLAAGVLERIATLRVRVRGLPRGTSYEVRIDGQRMPTAASAAGWKVNPTRHSVEVRAPGYQAARRSITARERGTHTVDVAMVAARKPTTAPAPERSNTTEVALMATGFSIAGAALVVGAVTGALSLAKTADVKGSCEGDACPPAVEDDLATATTLANASNVAFAIAGGGLVVAIIGVAIAVASPAEPARDGVPKVSSRGLAWAF
jgi:hypothetical protein